MPSRTLQALYKRVGPSLFARAQRALKDDQKAQEIVQLVVIELSRLGELSDAEISRLGRELLKKQLEKRGSTIDSMNPEKD
jgi:predicted XRE-type DNA-binding protein